MKRATGIVCLLLSSGVVGCDYTTKALAVANFRHAPRAIVPQFVELTAAFNTDTGFGLLGSFVGAGIRLWLLRTVATLGALLVAALMAWRWDRSRSNERMALALIFGGAIGNAMDRWTRGYVVDFIRVGFWPVFNVADIALSIGAALLLWDQVLRSRTSISIK